MDNKNTFCFVCTELQKPPEIHAPRLEYPLEFSIFNIYFLYQAIEQTTLPTLRYSQNFPRNISKT